MNQVLPAASNGFNLSGSVTAYNTISGGHNWSTTEAVRKQLIAASGKLKSLKVELSGAPGSGKSYTITLRINGVDTALTCTIANTDTTGSDTTHQVTVAPGDEVSLSGVPSGTPAEVASYWSLLFEGDNAADSLTLGLGGTEKTAVHYTPVSDSVGTHYPEPDEYVWQLVSTPGKFKNLYVKLDTSPGTAPEAYRFKLYVNGVATALTCDITAPDITGNDTTHEVTVAAGDRLSFRMEPLNSPTNNCRVYHGMVFEADSGGESLILGGSIEEVEDGYTTPHVGPRGIDFVSLALEATRQQLGQQCIIGNLYVMLENAPGVSGDGKSRTFTLRVNGVDTEITCTLDGDSPNPFGTVVTGNDTSHRVTISDGDKISLGHSHTGIPTASDAYWGLSSIIGKVYPLGVLTRVTSLIHRYAQGLYALQIGLGGVVTGEAGGAMPGDLTLDEVLDDIRAGRAELFTKSQADILKKLVEQVAELMFSTSQRKHRETVLHPFQSPTPIAPYPGYQELTGGGAPPEWTPSQAP